jgi:5-bromo-4-chloroindolyl phosphate hydrolysis protein
MVILTAKLVMLAIVIAAGASVLIGPSAFNEQIVKAQNMAEKNMTDSAGNMTETDNASGEISSMRDNLTRCRAC